MLRGYLTMAQLAERLGVSRQRARVLCDTYGVPVRAIHPRLGVVLERHVDRIPPADERLHNRSPQRRAQRKETL